MPDPNYDRQSEADIDVESAQQGDQWRALLELLADRRIHEEETVTAQDQARRRPG